MRYLKVTELWKKMAEAGITTYWYAPKLILRLEKQKKAIMPKTDTGRIRMTAKQMDSFVEFFRPGGKMRYP